MQSCRLSIACRNVVSRRQRCMRPALTVSRQISTNASVVSSIRPGTKGGGRGERSKEWAHGGGGGSSSRTFRDVAALTSLLGAMVAVAVTTREDISAFASPPRPTYHHESSNNLINKIELQKVVDQLAAVVGPENVTTDSSDLEERGKPLNSYHSCPRSPNIIVRPSSTHHIQQIVKICSAAKLPITPYGGGTSLEGQLLMPNGGVSIEMSHMNAVLRLSEPDQDVTVQPGIGYIELNEYLKGFGLWFPLDPGPGASLGGMMACRCSGSTAVRYGTMRENVISASVVTANGELVKTGTRAKKSAAGYDLTRLFVGSEGTLGLTTELTLKVYKIPTYSTAMRCCFNSIDQAAMVVQECLSKGLAVSRAELMDDTMVSICNEANSHDAARQYPVMTTLMFEFSGESPAYLKEMQARVTEIAMKRGASNCRVAATTEESKEMWKERKEALWSTIATYPDSECMITDVCVPLSALPALILSSKKALDQSPLPAPIVAHAGDGNFHAFIMFDKEKPEEVSEAKRLSRLMVDLAQRMGGTCTGEHGVGVGKVDYLVKELGQPAVSLMATIKRAMDPDNIMNPGKVIPHTKDPVTGKVTLCN